MRSSSDDESTLDPGERFPHQGGPGAHRSRSGQRTSAQAHPAVDASPEHLSQRLLDEEEATRLKEVLGMTEPKAPRRAVRKPVDTLRDED